MAPTKANAPEYSKDEKVLCFHLELLYEAKVLDVKQKDPNDKSDGYSYKIHYKGWKNTYVPFFLLVFLVSLGLASRMRGANAMGPPTSTGLTRRENRTMVAQDLSAFAGLRTAAAVSSVPARALSLPCARDLSNFYSEPHANPFSVAGTTGCLKNASGSSQMRTRSLQAT